MTDQCEGKRAWKRQTQAFRALNSIARKTEANIKTPIRTYRCPKCKQWHITSKPRPKRNRGT